MLNSLGLDKGTLTLLEKGLRVEERGKNLPLDNGSNLDQYHGTKQALEWVVIALHYLDKMNPEKGQKEEYRIFRIQQVNIC